MVSSKELVNMFFNDLHDYNSSNFKTLANADLSMQDAVVHKAFSSVVTRYFIFKEKHPELSEVELNILYFKLKLDLIAAYFTEYPDTTTDNLVAFQLELKKYLKSQDRKNIEELPSSIFFFYIRLLSSTCRRKVWCGQYKLRGRGQQACDKDHCLPLVELFFEEPFLLL